METAQNSHFILHWLISGIAVLITSKIVPGFNIRGFIAALLAVLVIGLVNAFIWPVLFFLALPITFLTLGLFTFVINGAVLKISALVIPGFEVNSWWSAILGSIVLSVTNYLLHYYLT